MYGSRRSTRTARNPQSGRGVSGSNNHGTSAVTPGTRSTRGVRKSRGRQTASGAAGSAAAESGGTTTGPVRKFALVRRRPAPHIAMWVEKWVPVTELTEEERAQYDKENLPKEMVVPMMKPELLVLADETTVATTTTTTTTTTSNAAIPMTEEQQPAEVQQQTITEMSVQPMDIAHDTALSQGENPTLSIMEEETQQLPSCRTVQTNSEGNDSTAVTEAQVCTDSKAVAIAELSSAGMEPLVAAVTTATTTTTTTIATEAATPVATGLTPDATETISKPEIDTHALTEDTTNENPVVATNEAATVGTYDTDLPPPQQDITPMLTTTTTTTTTEIPVTTDGMLHPVETSSTADTAAREESVKVSMEHPAPTLDEDLPAAKKPRLL
ncbi:hypothetical protein IV203_035525 [Nitzschia inconspicua]|uniref:Uncharacterized protein n=1 Tax=Nitzschia inconspicua TaxID=303405 RepID=A0A9K3LGD7_9STRA|nr:hypothetical protein IV203_035525 [Nitzschia inconspicua]